MKPLQVKKICQTAVLMGSLCLSVACASGFKSSLESARFDLDNGDYSSAIAAAQDALTSDPGNVEASRILASSYLGRSGINYLDLASQLSGLPDSAETTYRTIADALPETDDPQGLLDDLHSAVTTLEALDGLSDSNVAATTTFDDSDLANASFDLGVLKMIEHFANGVYKAGYFDTAEHTVDETTVQSIDDTDTAIVQNDLLDFDNLVTASGVDSFADTLSSVRQSFCILKNLSGGADFTTADLQAFVGCELSSDPASFDTTQFNPAVANCDALKPDNQSDEVTACYDVDSAL